MYSFTDFGRENLNPPFEKQTKNVNSRGEHKCHRMQLAEFIAF